MISAVTAFKQKFKLVSSQLQPHQLWRFKNIKSELENKKKKKNCDQFDSARYIEQVTSLVSDFDRQF